MSKRVKGILIDSVNQTLKEVEIADFRDIQRLVGGFFEIAYTWGNGDTLYVNDEGLLNGTREFFRIEVRADQPLAGNALIVGSDDEGESVDAKHTIADITPLVRFMTLEQVHSWGKANASEPAIMVGDKVIARYGSLISNVPKDTKE